MSRSFAVYAVGRDPMTDWAERTLRTDAVVVRERASVDEQPPGTLWFCAPADAPALRGLRPHDVLVEVRPGPSIPWAQLAHDLRGPTGVVHGALEELGGEDPMIALALRGTRQLVHLAECWEVLGSDELRLSTIHLGRALQRARATLSSIEPRRAQRVEFDACEEELVTDERRFHLGLVRLFSYALRATRGRIRVSCPDPQTLRLSSPEELEWGATLESAALEPDALFERSSRLATALALLAPITERWEASAHEILWVVQAR